MDINSIATKADIESAKKEILSALSSLINKSVVAPPSTKFLRTRDVRLLLGISPNKLQDMRFKGEIPFKRIGKTYFYPADTIHSLLNK